MGWSFFFCKKKLGFNKDKLSLIKEILDSEAGRAGISIGLGYLLEKYPNEHKMLIQLAREFRVAGKARGIEAGLDLLLEEAQHYMMPIIGKLIEPSTDELMDFANIDPHQFRVDMSQEKLDVDNSSLEDYIEDQQLVREM